MTVLIVDDEFYICEELSDVFKYFGINCFQSNCVEDALQKLRDNNQITMVITDLKMPYRSGEDLIKIAYKELRLKTPFVVITGNIDDDETKHRILSNYKNVVDFIQKPVDIEEITKLAKHYFG